MVEDLQSEVSVTKQEKVDIIKESLKKILSEMPNWKSPDPGFTHFTEFTIYSKLLEFLSSYGNSVKLLSLGRVLKKPP